MKNNPETWSNEIFEWIQNYPFDTLSIEQQHEVLNAMSMEDYTEMYESNQLLQAEHQPSNRRQAMKSDLLNRFDQQYSSSSFASSMLWKAASVLLFLTSAYFGYKQFNTSTIITEPIVLHDTIYVDKLIPQTQQSSVVHLDTIKTASSPSNRINPIIPKPHSSHKTIFHQVASTNRGHSVEASPVSTINSNEIPVVSLNQLHSSANSNKRNSRKFDSLEQSMPFVSL